MHQSHQFMLLHDQLRQVSNGLLGRIYVYLHDQLHAFNRENNNCRRKDFRIALNGLYYPWNLVREVVDKIFIERFNAECLGSTSEMQMEVVSWKEEGF